MTRTMTITITALTLGLVTVGGCNDRYREDTAEATNTQALESSLERSREHVDAAADDFLRPDPMMAPPDPSAPYPGYDVDPPTAPADEPFEVPPIAPPPATGQTDKEPMMVPPIGPPPATGTDEPEPKADAANTKDVFMSSA